MVTNRRLEKISSFSLRDAVVMLLIVIIFQLLILSGDIETNPGPVATDKPTMIELISLMKADGEYLRTIKWITSLSRAECVDFAHLLLNDSVKVKTHQKKSDTDEFVRDVFDDWLSCGDGSKAACTWGALADCMVKAGLPGDLVKAIRETCPSVTCTSVEGVEEVYMPPRKKMKSFIIENGPIQILVEPDIPRGLLTLMKEYADMLVALEKAELCNAELKSFLSHYCNENAFEKCSSPKEVIDTLKNNLKIYIFNIDTLMACCKHFKSQDVKQIVQQYYKHLDEFLSATSVKSLQDSLRTKVVSGNVQRVTLKLNDPVSHDTLGNLNKLVDHFFGNNSKAFILFEIQTGCICVTWIVPPFLIPTLKSEATRLSIENLASNGVLELIIADFRIVANEAAVEHPYRPPTIITPSPSSSVSTASIVSSSSISSLPPHTRQSVGSRIVAFFASCAGSRRHTRHTRRRPHERRSHRFIQRLLRISPQRCPSPLCSIQRCSSPPSPPHFDEHYQSTYESTYESTFSTYPIISRSETTSAEYTQDDRNEPDHPSQIYEEPTPQVPHHAESPVVTYNIRSAGINLSRSQNIEPVQLLAEGIGTLNIQEPDLS